MTCHNLITLRWRHVYSSSSLVEMWIRSRNRSCLKNTKKVTRKMVTMIVASLLHVLPSTKLLTRHFHTSSPPNTATIIPRRDISISVRPRADDTPLQSEQQKQMDLSVLRFTLGEHSFSLLRFTDRFVWLILWGCVKHWQEFRDWTSLICQDISV